MNIALTTARPFSWWLFQTREVVVLSWLGNGRKIEVSGDQIANVLWRRAATIVFILQRQRQGRRALKSFSCYPANCRDNQKDTFTIKGLACHTYGVDLIVKPKGHIYRNRNCMSYAWCRSDCTRNILVLNYKRPLLGVQFTSMFIPPWILQPFKLNVALGPQRP